MKRFMANGCAVLLAACLIGGTGSAKGDENTSGTTPSERQPDNSGKNERDRNHATLTPGNQGNSKTDRDLTQKIRRAITSGTNHFSMDARNVKIITKNGKVTLRGPVKAEEEKSNIEAIAKAQGATEVDDQLEVKGDK